MNILALDPGPQKTAWCFLSEDNTISAGIDPNEDVRELVLAKKETHHLAIEMIAAMGMPVGAEVFETCKWIGRFAECYYSKNPVYIYRREEKIFLCGSMKANDSTIRQVMIDRFGPPGTKKNPGKTYGFAADMWQALAVAVTARAKLEGKLI